MAGTGRKPIIRFRRDLGEISAGYLGYKLVVIVFCNCGELHYIIKN